MEENCYTMVGEDIAESIFFEHAQIDNEIYEILLSSSITVQRGDVVGYIIFDQERHTARFRDGVLLSQNSSNESVWYSRAVSNPILLDTRRSSCQVSTGCDGNLRSFTSVAPLLTVAISKSIP